ncbi:MAG: hypothetical protein GY795_04220 [Desulfobacterales bacterium]|nr:hypothetical protein [Desulfobacterales bacterium]
MNWTNLLSATIRLTDAYDSNREPGSSSTQVGPENRRHNSEGIWFELAVFILEYLQRKDEETPGSFISRVPLHREIQQTDVFKNIQAEDINYIINLLATPCELKFSLQDVKGTFDTILTEKAREGTGIRLSANGRTTCLLAYGIDDWIYTDIEAYKLTRALELGNFDDFIEKIDKIIKKIRIESHEITKIKEMPALSERKKKLLTDKELYLNTIENTQQIITNAKIMLNTDESVQKRISIWIEKHPDDFTDDIIIKERVDRLLQILESFSRNFSSLIDETQTKSSHVIEPVNFYDAGKYVIKNWSAFSADTLFNLFLANGFWQASDNQIAITDLVRVRKIPLVSQRTRMVIPTGKPEKIKHPVEIFMEKHGLAFRDRIMEGPICLSEIIESEDWNICELTELSSVLGLFIDPSVMGINKGRIIIVPDEQLSVQKKMPFGDIKSMDIQMIYLPET